MKKMSWNTDQKLDPHKNLDDNNLDVHETLPISKIDDDRRKLPSLYHGTWPMERDLWNGNDSSAVVSSVMSFTSNTSNGLNSSKQQKDAGKGEIFDPKMDVICSLFGMLLGNASGCEDTTTTLLSLSNSTENCLKMRKSGCLPLLVQLIHSSDQSLLVRRRASTTLFNIVRATQDQTQARQELHVLELVEQLRDYSQHLLSNSENCKESPRHPITALSMLTKLSVDETHRHTICHMGGLHAIAEIIELDHREHGSQSTDDNCISLRRFAGVTLTNLTCGDSKNKSILCSFGEFIKVWVSQFNSNNEHLRQVTANVLRNLSWRADATSKRILREMNSVSYLTHAALQNPREPTLKSILSALWNLSAHCTKNKVDICIIDGALEFIVEMISLESPSKLQIVEHASGILRNVSSHIAMEEKYRIVLRSKNCIQVLIRLLKSTNSTIISNVCGTLWNLSARCPEDQKELLNLGVVTILRDLAVSQHKMISMGATSTLKNLYDAINNSRRQSSNLIASVPSQNNTSISNIPVNIKNIRHIARVINKRSHSVESTPVNDPEERPLSSFSWHHQFYRHPSRSLDDVEPSTNEKAPEIIEKSESNQTEVVDYQKSPYSERRKGSPIGSPYFERRRNNSGPYEIEGDEPVDYSQQYLEKNQSKTEKNIEVQSQNDDKSFPKDNPNIFGDYAETDLDQPTDYSLRYAEDDTDDDEKPSTQYFTPTEQEDTVKTYCTEGTPYETPFNFSNATSMSDLRLDETKDSESSKKIMKKITKMEIKQKSFKEEKELNTAETTSSNKNNEILETNCQEKTIYYYEEGTPRRLSPVNSLSFLGSSLDNKNDAEVIDLPEDLIHKKDKPVKKEDTEDTVGTSNEQSPQKQNDKEGKVVTFGSEDHYAEETPLMFSRSSSFGSLSGLEQISIHDDRSSIISDFSRRTSGVVSPSELPDSPTQTVPPSPRYKNSIDYSFRNNARGLPTFSKYTVIQRPRKSIFDDHTEAFKEESTPIEFSAATSLSSLTIDDDMKHFNVLEIEKKCETHGEKPTISLPIRFLDIETEDVLAKEKKKDTNRQYQNQSDGDEEDDENILAACINIGMQNNRYRSLTKKNEHKTQTYPTLVSNLIRYQTSSTLDRLELAMFEPRSGSSPLKTKLLDVPTVSDSVHVYCTEDTPADISPAGSQSNLSALSMPSIIEDFEKPNDESETRNNLSDSSDSSILFDDDDDEKILDECIQSGMPKRSSPFRTLSLVVNIHENLPIFIKKDKCCSQSVIEHHEERFNISFDDSPNQSDDDDDAILAKCIESGMPKSTILSTNPSTSTSRSIDTTKNNLKSEQTKSLGSEDSLSLSNDEEDLILEQCIRSGMPKASTSTSNYSQILKDDSRRVSNVSISSPRNYSPRKVLLEKDYPSIEIEDEIASYADISESINLKFD
ncbi:hypothetical protein HCN44_010991 [Aphidius gifuensis]|uniref:Adenomatous polyposis coli protein n=1 Tax=Aphidius gifuensis TaxID=684658 RepID=A0A835CYK8_APHGI|nr:adenomatous polyposis coli homolog [Aphidius gifuensis]XP_044003961.1 adenomatous polyposis coli homolog [Aphidius gifuensis]KAF7998583.1 hypothetical protein HCN44_010991 [Aphidius gifuensis]